MIKWRLHSILVLENLFSIGEIKNIVLETVGETKVEIILDYLQKHLQVKKEL